MIKEVIVVEGKDDITAVKAAIDAEVIATGGFWYKKELIDMLREVNERQGIIIFTDPDYAGEQIRKDLTRKIGNCKHAFLPQAEAIKKGDLDIGVENASKEDIRTAIEKARPIREEKKMEFSQGELFDLGFMAGRSAREKRERLGSILGIGYSNSKQLLSRLNNFGISREEFNKAVERIEEENGR